jgi:hypothetical protein
MPFACATILHVLNTSETLGEPLTRNLLEVTYIGVVFRASSAGLNRRGFGVPGSAILQGSGVYL